MSYLKHWMGLHGVVTNNIRALRNLETKTKETLRKDRLNEQLDKIKRSQSKVKKSGSRDDVESSVDGLAPRWPMPSRVRTMTTPGYGNIV